MNTCRNCGASILIYRIAPTVIGLFDAVDCKKCGVHQGPHNYIKTLFMVSCLVVIFLTIQLSYYFRSYKVYISIPILIYLLSIVFSIFPLRLKESKNYTSTIQSVLIYIVFTLFLIWLIKW